MIEEKKPDNVVFNSVTQKYDAALIPYPTSIGAPVITITDTVTWKNRSINKINHKVEARYLELKNEYKYGCSYRKIITVIDKGFHLFK